MSMKIIPIQYLTYQLIETQAAIAEELEDPGLDEDLREELETEMLVAQSVVYYLTRALN